MKKKFVLFTLSCCFFLQMNLFGQSFCAQNAGWPLNQTGYDSTLIQKLDAAITKNTYKDLNSLVVIKDGALLLEKYYNGTPCNRIHNPRSVGKTFASAALGIAIEEGYIGGIDQNLGAFYDLKKYNNYHHSKESVTLHHLLTMSSGFDGFDFVMDSPGNEENMYPQPNWVEWTLNLPMATDRKPGDQWFYFTAGVVVLGDIIHQSVPGGLEQYTHEKLFAPLGICMYQWQHTPQGVANTAGGFQLRPVDFAKFGQLYKNKGKWNGQQVLPEKWVETSFQPYYQTTNEADQYGYLWWNKTYQVGGKDYEVFYCSGNGGNKIFVFKDYDAVIVVTASAYGQRYAHPQVDEMMEQYVIPAVFR